LNALLTGDYLGMKNFGAIYGILNVLANLGGSLGPAGAGFYFDKNGTYLPVFALFIVLALIGVVISLTIKPAASRPAMSGVYDETPEISDGFIVGGPENGAGSEEA